MSAIHTAGLLDRKQLCAQSHILIIHSHSCLILMSHFLLCISKSKAKDWFSK